MIKSYLIRGIMSESKIIDKSGIMIVIIAPILTLILISFIVPATPMEAHSYADDSDVTNHSDKFTIGSDTFTLTIPKEKYDKQTEINMLRCGKIVSNPIQLVNPNDEYVQLLADELSDKIKTTDEKEMAMEICYFVYSQIKYNSDESIYGANEYWATPLETLYLRTGDCEDQSILACSIMLAMNINAVLLDWEGHCAPGVIYNDEVYRLDKIVPSPNLTWEGTEPNIYDKDDIAKSKIAQLLGVCLHSVRDILPIKP